MHRLFVKHRCTSCAMQKSCYCRRYYTFRDKIELPNSGLHWRSGPLIKNTFQYDILGVGKFVKRPIDNTADPEDIILMAFPILTIYFICNLSVLITTIILCALNLFNYHSDMQLNKKSMRCPNSTTDITGNEWYFLTNVL